MSTIPELDYNPCPKFGACKINCDKICYAESIDESDDYIVHDSISEEWIVRRHMHYSAESYGELCIYTDREHQGIISDLSVIEEARKDGLGFTMLIRLEQDAISRGCTELVLQADRDGWQREWYKRLGYTYHDEGNEPRFIWMIKNVK